MEIARAGNLGSIESSGTCQYWVCWRRRCRPFAIYLYKLPNQFADDCMSAGSYFLQIGRLQSLTIGAFWILFEAHVMPGFLFCSRFFLYFLLLHFATQRNILFNSKKDRERSRNKGTIRIVLKTHVVTVFPFFATLCNTVEYHASEKSGNANSPLALHHMNDRKCVSVLCEKTIPLKRGGRGPGLFQRLLRENIKVNSWKSSN